VEDIGDSVLEGARCETVDLQLSSVRSVGRFMMSNCGSLTTIEPGAFRCSTNPLVLWGPLFIPVWFRFAHIRLLVIQTLS
jgi:hypothetical protein